MSDNVVHFGLISNSIIHATIAWLGNCIPVIMVTLEMALAVY
jgi:hypothetical protein